MSNEEIEFSMIDTEKTPQMNFSVGSILTERDPAEQIIVKNNKQTNQVMKIVLNEQNSNLLKLESALDNKGGSFLQDLEKLEKSLSFQTVLFDVYNCQGEQNKKQNRTSSKSSSTLRKTKDNTFSLTKDIDFYQYEHLIIDFAEKPKKSFSKLHSKKGSSQILLQKAKSAIKSTQKFLKSSTKICQVYKGRITKSVSVNYLELQNKPKQKQDYTQHLKSNGSVILQTKCQKKAQNIFGKSQDAFSQYYGFTQIEQVDNKKKRTTKNSIISPTNRNLKSKSKSKSNSKNKSYSKNILSKNFSKKNKFLKTAVIYP